MSKSSSKNITVGTALSLTAEITKALSPVLRGLTQEQADKLKKDPQLLQQAFRELVYCPAKAVCLQTVETADDYFRIKDVRDEVSRKTDDLKLALRKFVFGVGVETITVKGEMDKYAIVISVFPVTMKGKVLVEGDMVTSFEFEALLSRILCSTGSLVPVEKINDLGVTAAMQMITAEYIAQHGTLVFGLEGEDPFISLTINEIIQEMPISYQQVRMLGS